MRRGTTPDYIATIPGYDLRACAVYVTIAQSGKQATLTGGRLEIEYDPPTEGDAPGGGAAGCAGEPCGDVGGTSIRFRLTQEETLGMRAGQASVQARWIDLEGTALATEIGTISIMPVLLEEVIAYDGLPE